MAGLQTVPCHIAGMGLGIVSLEDKIVFDSLIDRQDAGEGRQPHDIGL